MRQCHAPSMRLPRAPHTTTCAALSPRKSVREYTVLADSNATSLFDIDGTRTITAANADRTTRRPGYVIGDTSP